MKSYKFHSKNNHVEVELTIPTPREAKYNIKRHNKLIEVEIITDKTHKKWGT